MAVANTKSTAITALDAGKNVPLRLSGAALHSGVATVDVAAADDDNSVYRLLRVHSSWSLPAPLAAQRRHHRRHRLSRRPAQDGGRRRRGRRRRPVRHLGRSVVGACRAGRRAVRGAGHQHHRKAHLGDARADRRTSGTT